MRRQRLITATGVLPGLATAAGCAFFGIGGTQEFVVEPVSDLVELASRDREELTGNQLRILDTIQTSGSATTYGYRPFEARHLRTDDDFFRIRTDRTGTENVVREVLLASIVDPNATDPAPMDRYPSADQAAIQRAYRLAVVANRENHSRQEGHVFRRRSPNDSSLLPTPKPPVVSVASEAVALRVERRSIVEEVYETTLEQIARDPASFRDHVADEHASIVDPDALSDRQRRMLEEAIEAGRYTERGQVSGALGDLLRHLRGGSRYPGGWTLFRYESSHFRFRFLHSD